MHSIRHAIPLLIALSVPTAWAADNAMDHNKQPPEQSNAQAAGAPPSGGADKMAGKQEHMLKMHKLLHDIDAESDPTKRAALMKQHEQMMHQGMKKMRGGKNCGHMEHEPTT